MERGRYQLSAIVADDDPDLASVLCELLQIGGVNVIGVGHNGKEAVDLYEKLRPDVVFLDIRMPQYDGFYALENIRLVNKNAKVLMITANDSVKTVMRCSELGAIAYVEKPFDFNKLQTAIAASFQEYMPRSN